MFKLKPYIFHLISMLMSKKHTAYTTIGFSQLNISHNIRSIKLMKCPLKRRRLLFSELVFRQPPPLLCHRIIISLEYPLDRHIEMTFYCEKYTYHFLTIAICWCHPTHWPTLRNVLRNLKRPVSECELACPPSGHVTMLVNNLHYFCWPS